MKSLRYEVDGFIKLSHRGSQAYNLSLATSLREPFRSLPKQAAWVMKLVVFDNLRFSSKKQIPSFVDELVKVSKIIFTREADRVSTPS